MAKDVVMPALGMAQETGTLLRWLKAPGDSVTKGEMLMEVETDKAMVEVEATASGILSDVTAQPGDVVPVGHVIARIVGANEPRGIPASAGTDAATGAPKAAAADANGKKDEGKRVPAETRISPIAARVAAEHGIDVSEIKPKGGVIQKEDVLAYVASHPAAVPSAAPSPLAPLPAGEGDRTRAENKAGAGGTAGNGRVLASPKARRLAVERGVELGQVEGSGPEGAVLAADVMAFEGTQVRAAGIEQGQKAVAGVSAASDGAGQDEPVHVGNLWRVMVERLSNAWTTIPHFYLARDVNAARLIAWRNAKKTGAGGAAIEKITYTDLLVKLTAAALIKHTRVNASWQGNDVVLHRRINVGLAVAVEQGLTVPVIHDANELSLAQLCERRLELIERAKNGRLTLQDIGDGTFTISNLGMYGVDAFNAIVNPPQAAILAVSRIAERVVPVNHQPAVQPMMTLTLSCDHRVIDGARGAQFLDTLAALIEEPLSLLD